MSIASTLAGVRCGNHPNPTYHENIDSVRACFREQRYSRHLDRMAGEPEVRDLDLSAFDEVIQTRENEADQRAAYEKMLRDSPKPLDEDGIYRNPQTGQIFKVYHTVHGANQMVAKELVLLEESAWFTKTIRRKEVTVKAEFVYRGKAGLRGLTGDMKMTLEEGKKYGAIYGVCVRCAATLTREESIERAMGPVCAGKANWA